MIDRDLREGLSLNGAVEELSELFLVMDHRLDLQTLGRGLDCLRLTEVLEVLRGVLLMIYDLSRLLYVMN